MSEKKIKEILGDAIQPDGSLTGLHGGTEYVQWPHWRAKDRKGKAHLDGNFSAAELRALMKLRLRYNHDTQRWVGATARDELRIIELALQGLVNGDFMGLV